MGASHIAAILEACGAEGQAQQGPGFIKGLAPAFREWAVAEGKLPDRLMVSSVYVGHTGPYWGPALAAEVSTGVLGIAPGFQALLTDANDDERCTTLFVTMRGEEYYHSSLAGVADPFDFLLPERPDLILVPGRTVIALDVIQDQLSRHLKRTVLELQAIRLFCPRLRIVRIIPPPPSSSEALRQWTTAQQIAEHATQQLPTSVRLKLWLLYADMLEKSTVGLGLDTLPVPAEATHELGTLLYEYMGDFIHGNAAYGALVCRQISALVSPTMGSSS